MDSAQAALTEVAVFAPLWGFFTYSVPRQWQGLAKRGCRVLVPLGRRQVVGLVVRENTSSDNIAPAQIKPLTELFDEEPLIPQELLDLLLWTASYYMAPPGEVLRAALPAAMQARERLQLRLSEEGKRVLRAQNALLLAEEDQLDARQLSLLRRIEERKTRSLSSRQLRGLNSPALKTLFARGLIVRTAYNQDKSRHRTDLILELPPDAVAELPRRAPRQEALLQAVQQAGGTIRLSALPPPLRGYRQVARTLAKNGLLRLEECERYQDPFLTEPLLEDRLLQLTTEQQTALSALLAAFATGDFSAFLLHGVTSSGKTEVYLRLIAQVLAQGRSALVLVPEISLTPQLAARFRCRFGELVAVLHSGLTDADRYGQWQLIRSKKVRIVVGARSAVFAPLSDLGAVIVDEEHDPSFKQEEGMHYQARDVALMRAKMARAIAVLGSATPSLESYHGVQLQRLKLLELPSRATPRPLPQVEIVDLRLHQPSREGMISAPLAAAMGETLSQKEQAILFLNRRGFSSFILCTACGHVFRCQHCSVTLTYHRTHQRIICHYCGFAINVPSFCPTCQAERIELLGLGTEQVEQHLQERFPAARIARLDRDSATSGGLRMILDQMRRQEIDILIGTQMVTKGHDFPLVTLVGVICADLGLHFPDFRAAERTFQLLTQVAGRAGRGDRPGRVLIQTYSPQHPSLLAAGHHDYLAFFHHELAAREELGYPPYAYLAAIRIDGLEARAVERQATQLADFGRKALLTIPDVTLLGPAAAPLQKLKDRTRWLLLVKGRTRVRLRQVVDEIMKQVSPVSKTKMRVTVDIDPHFML